MTRFEQLRQLLDEGRYFKLVCGAGNENSDDVYKLTLVYTLAGATGFDVSASPEIVRAGVAGIDRAYELADSYTVAIPLRPFIKVSVGMRGDHHVRKAIITDACVGCNRCIPVCPTAAIPAELTVIRDLCIGCGNCEAVCPPKVAAISYEHNQCELAEILPECLAAGAENIELHAAVPDNDTIMQEWEIVAAAQPDNFVSLCLDRYHLSNVQLIERIRQAYAVAGERLMIQADGVPMSGGSNDFNTTLQAIAIADIINKELLLKDKRYRHIPTLLSGGTNGFTGDLARQCAVPFHGVSIGTHARKIVKDFIHQPGFENDPQQIGEAVVIARDLIRRNLKHD
ncbi:MAG: 4Fe-4S binding protein [Candidatus Neomarinimicrobiota bacterium]